MLCCVICDNNIWMTDQMENIPGTPKNDDVVSIEANNGTMQELIASVRNIQYDVDPMYSTVRRIENTLSALTLLLLIGIGFLAVHVIHQW
jgi:hypothetical protein